MQFSLRSVSGVLQDVSEPLEVGTPSVAGFRIEHRILREAQRGAAALALAAGAQLRRDQRFALGERAFASR
jgi:hypothetical protein